VSRTARWLVWLLALALAVALAALWEKLPHLDSQPLQRVALFAALGLLMPPLVFCFPPLDRRRASLLIVGAALLPRLALLDAPVSDDVHRYLWEGRLTLEGANPYAMPADDPRREPFHDHHWQRLNHRDKPTAYPPGFQWLMAAAVAIHYGPASARALALLGDLAALLLILALLRREALPPRWAGFYAFNPVVLIAFAAEAHFDSLMVAAMLGTWLAADARRHRLAWLALGIAIQIKLIAVLLAPLLFTGKARRGAWLLLPVLALPSLPFAGALAEWLHGVHTFGGGGFFNGPFPGVLAFAGMPVDLARPVAASLFLACAALVSLARWRGLPLLDASFAMLSALLVFSPIVHFWYLAWILPLACLRPSLGWTTASLTMAGYFLAWLTLQRHGWWGFGHGVSSAIWLPAFAAFLLQRHPLLRRLPQHLRRPATPPAPGRLAIVVPALAPGPKLDQALARLRAEFGPTTPIVASLAGEPETTPPGARPDHLVHGPAGRGGQIARGITAAGEADWLVIAHADAAPPPGFANRLTEALRRHPRASMIVAGQRFATAGAATLLVEILNELRAVFTGTAFGDQTMILRRSALEQAGGFPTQPLMEDVEVSLRLRAVGPVLYLGDEWRVSGAKWRGSFPRRFATVIELVLRYRLARRRGPEAARTCAEALYRRYYPASR